MTAATIPGTATISAGRASKCWCRVQTWLYNALVFLASILVVSLYLAVVIAAFVVVAYSLVTGGHTTLPILLGFALALSIVTRPLIKSIEQTLAPIVPAPVMFSFFRASPD
jgi:hypothetical protein